jgi:hypothetical protein
MRIELSASLFALQDTARRACPEDEYRKACNWPLARQDAKERYLFLGSGKCLGISRRVKISKIADAIGVFRYPPLSKHF